MTRDDPSTTRRGLLRGSGLALVGLGTGAVVRDGSGRSARESGDDAERNAAEFPTSATTRIDHSRGVNSAPSLRVRYPYGEHGGVSQLYRLDSPQTELYSRYWIRYDADFDPSGLGGEWGGPKQPGFIYPGEYGVDDPPDGTNGWSTKPNVTPSGGLSQYTWDMSVAEGNYGRQYDIVDDFPFGEWVSVTQRLALNTVSANGAANADGVLQVWVNDRRELDRRSMRFTTRPAEEGIYGWILFYFGGLEPSPKGQGLNFDEYVLTAADVTDRTASGADVCPGENAVVVF